MNRSVLSRTVAIGLIAAAVALSGCGRKGALEAPPGMAIKAATAGAETPTDETAKPAKKSDKPDKPFFLDPLLK